VINTYLSRDGSWLTVTSGTVRSVQNVAALLGEPAEDYVTVQQQHAGRERLDRLLSEWVRDHDAADALATMRKLEVTASLIYTMDDIVADPTYAEREAIIEVPDAELGSVRMQSVIPRMKNHPGAVWRTGPALGEDTDAVLRQYIGLSETDVSGLRERGVI
jgi:formyl-CoA transferase